MAISWGQGMLEMDKERDSLSRKETTNERGDF